MHQIREGLCDKAWTYQEKVKRVFDRRVKEDDFNIGYLVLRWDSRYEDKDKHGKFDNLWKGPYKVSTFMGKKSFFLTDFEDMTIEIGLVIGKFLKHYLT